MVLCKNGGGVAEGKSYSVEHTERAVVKVACYFYPPCNEESIFKIESIVLIVAAPLTQPVIRYCFKASCI